MATQDLENYGERFETGIIIAMSLLIVLSLAGVFALNAAFAPDCRHMDYTYCGEPAKPKH